MRRSTVRSIPAVNWGSPPQGPKGFTVVEIIVASVILFTSVTTAVTLFNFTSTNARLGEKKQDEQAAISDDLSSILQLNDQYRCLNTVKCSSENFYPNENQYISSNPNDLSSICTTDKNANDYPGRGFAPLLRDAVNQLGTSPKLTNLGIQRSAKVADNNTPGAPPHLYSVEWKNNSGTILRQVTLIPTIAAWCP